MQAITTIARDLCTIVHYCRDGSLFGAQCLFSDTPGNGLLTLPNLAGIITSHGCLNGRSGRAPAPGMLGARGTTKVRRATPSKLAPLHDRPKTGQLSKHLAAHVAVPALKWDV
jgi:hypothetical protein